MSRTADTLTYIGGASALVEFGGLRFVTDPTFDPAGSAFSPGPYTLTRTTAPALAPEMLTGVDAVLLSHDHHYDNLDQAGRMFLPTARRVVTTGAAAGRLGGNATGLAPWETIALPAPGGGTVTVTATPCRHGPAHADRGPVIGFVLSAPDGSCVYISGDTVWYEGMEEVAQRVRPRTAILFLGAATVEAVGPFPLTLTAEGAVMAARALAGTTIVPLHFEGWAHFRETRADVEQAFAQAGMAPRLRWPIPGKAIPI
ncbi:MAG TPA: MBL fold metallo-hydrolase [Gemmatimonadales bacterium]|nr:MBL fold metallo-hydrolase [Gemmatimonadales bacterium]